MKKIIILILMLVCAYNIFVFSANSITPEQIEEQIEEQVINKIEVKESGIISKLTGINFLSKQIAESIIEKQLKKEFNSKIKANLEIYSVGSLQNGIFKSLKVKSKNLRYDMFRISNFEAVTVNDKNRALYKKGRIYYPEELVLKYKGTITNNDINEILGSESFQNELKNNTISLNGINSISIDTPDVKIKDGKIYFTIPINTIFSKKPIKLKIATKANIENNKLVLMDVSFLSKSNIIKSSKVESILKNINPLAYQLKPINTKFCKIHVNNVTIDDDIITTEGTFIINKNYNE